MNFIILHISHTVKEWTRCFSHVIKTHANLSKKILEEADILNEADVKNAFEITKHAFEKLEDLFISSWEINDGSLLLENEIIVMLAWYREYKRKKI